jgi:hypothetical protein
MSTDSRQTPRPTRSAEALAREAEALRANLRRRKAQAAAREKAADEPQKAPIVSNQEGNKCP